mmetsp:Transcript_23862/g.68867  ORF Transcript_23862/g.68867 Transcript_23862/m.68867 type:complete len:201 (-) Transcript_23862:165-767(-)
MGTLPQRVHLLLPSPGDEDRNVTRSGASLSPQAVACRCLCGHNDGAGGHKQTDGCRPGWHGHRLDAAGDKGGLKWCQHERQAFGGQNNGEGRRQSATEFGRPPVTGGQLVADDRRRREEGQHERVGLGGTAAASVRRRLGHCRQRSGVLPPGRLRGNALRASGSHRRPCPHRDVGGRPPRGHWFPGLQQGQLPTPYQAFR